MDGVPPRSQLSEVDLQTDLDRIRRPGQISQLIKTDTCKILAGVHEGLTMGTPIHVFIPNPDQTGRCGYDEISVAYRPSHADLTRDMKYGIRSILKGGGIFSARETIGRVAAGAAEKKILKDLAGIEDLVDHDTLTLDQIESNRVRCPDHEYAEKMIAAIHAVRVRGEDQPIGGVVTCIVRNCPRGLLGSPFFDKLGAEFAKALQQRDLNSEVALQQVPKT
ncbi:putative chorismate synthase [Rosa chinensis]|uniref:chorismate synthase n=1 Tax=Rosa chinensis TaxID=74649 RepID=A0A2P6QZS3_ROSCH|nr:putative chorismate synthase [Rosa chinensis]